LLSKDGGEGEIGEHGVFLCRAVSLYVCCTLGGL